MWFAHRFRSLVCDLHSPRLQRQNRPPYQNVLHRHQQRTLDLRFLRLLLGSHASLATSLRPFPVSLLMTDLSFSFLSNSRFLSFLACAEVLLRFFSQLRALDVLFRLRDKFWCIFAVTFGGRMRIWRHRKTRSSSAESP